MSEIAASVQYIPVAFDLPHMLKFAFELELAGMSFVCLQGLQCDAEGFMHWHKEV